MTAGSAREITLGRDFWRRSARSRGRPAVSSLDKPSSDSPRLMYQYKWIPGGLAPPELVESMADLYSTQYGIWGNQGLHPGQPVKLTPERIRKSWLSPRIPE